MPKSSRETSLESDIYVATIDTFKSIDSITMHAQFSLSFAADSILYHVTPDSLSR